MRKRYSAGKFLPIFLFLTIPSIQSGVSRPDGPHISAIEPKAGLTTPGSRVRAYGSGFSADAVLFFGGLQVRETSFLSPSALEVVTPYLRPGHYQLQLKSGGTTIQSEVTFVVLPSQVDAEIDRAVALAEKQQVPTAIAILTAIASSHSDFQVRALAHYQAAQIYFAQGDWWRWGGEIYGIFDEKAGSAVQTSWRYGLSLAQTDYLLPTNNQPDHDLRSADIVVEIDVTQNPEPRFFRGLMNARYGNLSKAKIDSDFILSIEAGNPSYRALAAYIAVLGGDKSQLKSFEGEPIKDARALSLLGEAAYLSGDAQGAQQWWTQAAKEYPLGASLAYWAGKKHLARGQDRVAAALLEECISMAPNSKEGKEAKDLLATRKVP